VFKRSIYSKEPITIEKFVLTIIITVVFRFLRL